MTTLQDVLSLSMLSSFIWTVWFLIPKALNGRNRFGAICSILAHSFRFMDGCFSAPPCVPDDLRRSQSP